jgi:hypothetical protein
MHLNANDQGLLLVMLLGFACSVILLHLGELIVLALQLHAWKLAGGGAVALLLAVVWVGWQVQTRFQSGLRFIDLLAVLGVQVGLVICLPSRRLLRRKCRWEHERIRLQAEPDWRRAAYTPPMPGPRPLTRWLQRLHTRDAAGVRRGR